GSRTRETDLPTPCKASRGTSRLRCAAHPGDAGVGVPGDLHHSPGRQLNWTGGHIKFFSRKTLYDALMENKFIPEKFIGAGRMPYFWKSMIVIARRQS
ncbi:MAG: hypothetical protein ACK6AD_04925, partial [Cyanobacteriota bacterium]